ncbi:MAG: cytochrome c peroxidase [Burkholderiaceae bacterium]
MRPRTLLALIFALGLAACGGDETAAPLAADEVGLSRLELIGKRIFFDTSLSEPHGQSCATCHDPALAFSGNSAFTLGVAPGAASGRFGTRNVPTVMYAMFVPPFYFEDDAGEQVPVGGLFLDGRAASLEDQASKPFFNPVEMALPGPAALRERLAAASYAQLMRDQFGAQVFASPAATLAAAAQALAAFERTPRFAPFSSKYDAVRRGQAQLSVQESRGLALFVDATKGNCAACHPFVAGSKLDADHLFTDFTYDNLGVPRNRRIPANAELALFDLGLCGPARSDLVETRPQWCGAFRVPTLRNVALRPAFFHNGAITTLRDSVSFYVTRETDPFRWYRGELYDDLPPAFKANVNASEAPYDATPATGPRLSEAEIDDVVAFLHTLTDGWKP